MLNKLFNRYLLVLFGVALSFCFTLNAQAADPTIHAVSGGGNWNSASTWTEGRTPTSTDIVEIHGTVRVTGDANISGLVVISGANLQNQNNISPRLTVNGDVVNNGTIQNRDYSSYVLYLTVTGNITNNGTWKNAWTDLASTQSRNIGGTAPLTSPVTFLDSFEILNSPIFSGLVNFNDKTITVSSTTQSITLKANTILSGIIAGQGSLIMTGAITITGTTTANTIIFDSGDITINGGSFTANNIIARGANTAKIINANTIFNGSLTVNSGAIIQNNNNVTPRLTVNGNLINNGSIRNQYYPRCGLYLTISGDITNNGTWSNASTDFATMQSRTIGGTSSISGLVSFLEDIELLNSPIFAGGVNFNGKTITIASSSQSITVKGNSTLSGMIAGLGSLIIADSPIITGTTTANMIIFATGSPIFNGSFTANNIIIRGSGTKYVNATTTEFNGSLTVESGAIFQNHSSAYSRVIITGNVVNSGTINHNFDRGFYLTVSGNITNNGDWSNSWTDLTSTQSRTIGGAAPLGSPVTFLDSFEILNSPNFNGQVNFNNQTITMNSSAQNMTLKANTTLSGGISGQGNLIFLNNITITGTTTANAIIFDSGEMTVNGNFTANNIIIRGYNSSKNINADTIFNGSMAVESGGAIQDKSNVSARLTINGNVVNNGYIRNSNYPSYSFYLTVSGNITNNGTWNNTETDVIWPVALGATEYQFNIATSTSNWLNPVTVLTNSYNITSYINSNKYWRARANLGGLYSPWSNIRGINVDLFNGFTFNTIDSSSQMATRPINLTITSVDINGDPYNFAGTLNLSASNNGTTTPNTITMSNGSWTGTTSISMFGNNVTLTATGGGESGTSNAFNLKKKPVIIVPGVISSYLNKNVSGLPEVWPNVGEMIFSGEDSYLDDLKMDEFGEPLIASLMRPTDIFRNLSGNDIFQSLITELTSNGGYVENSNLFVYPYDWRRDINWIASGSPYPLSESLRAKIQEVKDSTGAEQVDIIAHSMGGLIVKDYIKHSGANSIDKFIDIATPHLGAPDSAINLLYGSDLNFSKWGIPFLNKLKVKEISQNFPSIYELLPSRNYFDASSTVYNGYIADLYDVDNNNITGNLNYDNSIDFIVNSGGNYSMANMNDAIHDDLDNFNPASYGVKAYNIIGCHQPTISRIYIINHYASSSYEYGLGYTNGDGTVPVKSAESLNGTISTYYNIDDATSSTHAFLSSVNGDRQLISSILSDSLAQFNFSSYPTIQQNNNSCGPLTGYEVSYHSPITLHIYDEQGRHVGPDAKGNIEINIPGAAYDVIGDNKFAFVPKGHNYKIIGQATGLGHFNARVQDIQDGKTVSEAYYNEVPIKSLSTNIEIDFANNKTNYEMKIDQKGDKIFSEKIKPNSILNARETEDRIKPETKAEISGQTVKLTSSDDNSKVLKTEYSLDGGKTWNLYSKAIDISNLDGSAIQYKSTDRAGNTEIIQEQTILMDKNTSKPGLSDLKKVRF